MGSVNKKLFSKDFENNFIETLNRMSSIQRAIQKIWNQKLTCRSSYLPYFKGLQKKYSSGETLSLMAALSPIGWRCGNAWITCISRRHMTFTPSLFSSFCQGVQGNTLRLGNFFCISIVLSFWCPKVTTFTSYISLLKVHLPNHKTKALVNFSQVSLLTNV